MQLQKKANMSKYYINKISKDNGDREVHQEKCLHLPSKNDVDFLGTFMDSHEAIIKAKTLGIDKPTPCYWCSFNK